MECRILDVNDLSEITDNRLIVYGAGQYGGFLYSFLELKGLAENVVCFAVTDTSGSSDTFCGKRVEPIDRLAGQLKDCMVILALGEKAAGEVLERLLGCEVKAVCRVNAQVVEDIRAELIAGYKKLPLQKNKIVFF